jgi:hypothetical protein
MSALDQERPFNPGRPNVRFAPYCLLLLVAQGMDWVGSRDPASMDEDRGPGNHQRYDASFQKISWTERNAIGITLQPVMQIVPRERPRNKIGDKGRAGFSRFLNSSLVQLKAPISLENKLRLALSPCRSRAAPVPL